jgi:hypothetical protein
VLSYVVSGKPEGALVLKKPVKVERRVIELKSPVKVETQTHVVGQKATRAEQLYGTLIGAHPAIPSSDDRLTDLEKKLAKLLDEVASLKKEREKGKPEAK